MALFNLNNLYEISSTIESELKELKNSPFYQCWLNPFLDDGVENRISIVKEMSRHIEVLRKNKIWALLENDYQLLCKKIIDFDQFKQCVADASRIWKEKMADESLKIGNSSE